MTQPHRLYSLLDVLGGLRLGHTVFKTGGHGDGWIEKGALFSIPKHLRALVRAQVRGVLRAFPQAQMVVSAVLATLVRQELGVRLAFTNRDAKGNYGFHRMYQPPPGSLVVPVEDLIFSGRDVRNQAGFFAASGLRLLGVGAWG
ncbi:MAG: hypothetical protein C4332_07010 [Meiothermus sp.]